jgi:4-diphosphocytidyl-2-C-methyl-D-erythritol kinase
VSTPWAYTHWQNSRELPGIPYVQQDFRGQKLHNELERPVFEKFVFLARIKTWLLEQKEVAAALMSGSGSTVFAVVPSNVDVGLVAKRAKAELDPELWTRACETL